MAADAAPCLHGGERLESAGRDALANGLIGTPESGDTIPRVPSVTPQMPATPGRSAPSPGPAGTEPADYSGAAL